MTIDTSFIIYWLHTFIIIWITEKVDLANETRIMVIVIGKLKP